MFDLLLRSLGYAPDPELDADMLDPSASYGSFVVGVVDGAIVAMGGIDRGEVRRIFVLPEHRRRGLATRIIRDLIHGERARSDHPICAIVAKTNLPARRLFTSLGFRLTGRAPEHHEMQHYEIFDGSEACRL